LFLNIHHIYLIFLFLCGSFTGSFLSVCIYRIPLYRSIAFNPSQCPNCNTPIKFRDNIPLISYLLLKGKCRNCKGPVSSEYFLVELITALMFVSFYIKFGLSFLFFKNLLLACLMVIIFFIDLKYLLIFNRTLFAGILLAFLFSFLLPPPGIKDSFSGMVAGYMFFVFIFWLGIILMFSSSLFSEVKLLLGEVAGLFTFKPKKYFKEFYFWFRSNWDTICIPVFLTLIIAFSMAILKFIDFMSGPNSSPYSFPAWTLNLSFGLFFLLLFLCFIIHITKGVMQEESYSETLRFAGRMEPFIFASLCGFPAFIALSLFREDDEELPPIGGGDAKFGALIGAFMGWERALLSFVISIFIGAFIGIFVISLKLFRGNYRVEKTPVPFGPVMVFATFIILFYQTALTGLYFQFTDWYFLKLCGFF